MTTRKATPTAGFTLIELLVVISIIALLVSILLPALSSAKRSAQVAGCLSNIRQLGMAQQMHANDYNDQLAYMDRRRTSGLGRFDISIDEKLASYDGRSVGGDRFWANRPRNHMFDPEGVHSDLWKCPLDVAPNGWPNNSPAGTTQRSRKSYGMTRGVPFKDRLEDPNGEDSLRFTGVAEFASVGNEGWSARLAEIPSTSSAVVMMDNAWAKNFQGVVAGELISIDSAMGSGASFFDGSTGREWPDYPSRFYAHENTTGADPTPSAVFADGHAESINVVEELDEINQGPKTANTVGSRFDAMGLPQTN